MSSRPKTIFLVDDDEFVRDALQLLLEQRQYQVESFASGRQFLSQRDPASAGCLVLDIHMPEMSGLDVLKELRTQRDGTPVILMTGRRDEEIDLQARMLDAVALFDKPIPHAALFEALEHALARQQPAHAP